jgi:hypothetical protein
MPQAVGLLNYKPFGDMSMYESTKFWVSVLQNPWFKALFFLGMVLKYWDLNAPKAPTELEAPIEPEALTEPEAKPDHD